MVTKESSRRQLEENKKNAFLSEQLFLLRYMPIGATKDLLSFDIKNWAQAMPLFQELNFKTLLKDLQKAGVEVPQKVKLSESKGYIFKSITQLEELEHLLHEAKKAKIIAVDTELDGMNPLENHLVGISFAFKKGEAYYVPFGHKNDANQLSREQVLRALQPILHDPLVKKIMHSGNFDERALMHYNCSLYNLDFDTLIAAHLVTEDWQRISLKSISEFYLNEPMLTFADVVTGNGYKNFSQVPLDLATEYAASDAHQTLQLFPILDTELKKQEMEKLYYDIELPLVKILPVSLFIYSGSASI